MVKKMTELTLTLEPELYDKQHESIYDSSRYVFIEASTKSGKAQPLDALIYTPSGYKYMRDITVGETVLTPTGKATIISIHPQGLQDIYKVTFSDGSSCRCTKDHLWEVGHNQYKYLDRLMTLSELMELPLKDLRRTYIPTTNPVEYNSQPVTIDPYCLGLLLGDGSFRGESLSFSSEDKELISELYGIGIVTHNNRCTYNIKKEKNEYRNSTITALKDLGLWGKYSDEKFIPSEYLYNSIEVRLAILQGLLDTDGSVANDGQPIFEQTSKQLALDVTTLVESLGGFVHCKTKVGSYKNNKGELVSCKTVYRLRIVYHNASDLFRLERKIEAALLKMKPVKRTFRTIELVGREECQCIKLSDKRGLYLTDRMIVTHNTVACLRWIFEEACKFSNGANLWWVAPVYKQTKIAYGRLRRGLLPYRNYGFKFSDTDLSITLPTGSIITFKSGDDADNLYGEDVVRAVVDEASRVKEEAWHALRSTLTATKGMVKCIGNVRGRTNWFYRLCRKAQEGSPDMAYYILTVYDAIEAGVIQQSEIEDAKNTLPEAVFNELYLCKPTDDGGNPFGLSSIRKCIKLMSENPVVVFGLDLAKSVDYSVLLGLDYKGDVCFYNRWQSSWEQTLNYVVGVVGNIPVIVDATGVGDPIVEKLRLLGVNIPDNGAIKYTSMVKQQLMESLAVVIQQQLIGFPDNEIVSELESFEYEYTRSGVKYNAPEGYHDDTVNALALANFRLIRTNVGDGVLLPQCSGNIRETSRSIYARDDRYDLKRLGSKDWAV